MVVCDSYNLDVLSDMIKLYIIYIYSIGNVEKNLISRIGLIVSMICFIISDIDFNIDKIDKIDKLDKLELHINNFILDSYLSYFNIGLGISLSCFLTKFLPSLPKYQIFGTFFTPIIILCSSIFSFLISSSNAKFS